MKLTDEEIINALKICTSDDMSCAKCPYEDCKHIKNGEYEIINGKPYDDISCDEWLKIDLFGVINRQKAEIERLINNVQLEVSNKIEKHIKSEAYKEFAERLCDGKVSNDKTVIEVNVLLKEMDGDGCGNL